MITMDPKVKAKGKISGTKYFALERDSVTLLARGVVVLNFSSAN